MDAGRVQSDQTVAGSAPDTMGSNGVLQSPGQAPTQLDADLHGPPVPRIPTPRRGPVPEAEAHSPRRTMETEAWTVPIARVSRDHPQLGFPVHGSISVGSVSAGYIVNGRELPASGTDHAILEEHRRRATQFGTDELVDALLTAGADVAALFPGSILGVGNISRGGGGKIPWSISHNAGRDADLAFYLLDSSGLQVVLPTLLKLSAPEGTVEHEGRTLTFDPARNWNMLASLLGNPNVDLQYAFCADFLVKRMFEYARQHGVSGRRIDELRGLVRQPRGTLPHDDHIHIRIRCSAEDQLEGCRDIEAGSERLPTSLAYRTRVKETARIAGNLKEAARRRAAAVELLGLLKARHVSRLLYSILAECDDKLSVAALDALAAVGARLNVRALAKVVNCTGSGEVARRAFQLLRRSGPRAATAAAKWLSDTRILPGESTLSGRPLVVQESACYLLGWTGSRKHVPLLLELAVAGSPEIARAAMWGVRAIAGHTVIAEDVLTHGLKKKEVRRLWKRWSARFRRADDALLDELRNQGYQVSELSARNARRLRQAIRGPDHLSLAVQRKLGRMVGRSGVVDIKDKEHAYWLWGRLLSRLRAH